MEIPVEHLVRDEVTRADFENALSKARLLYENVAASEEYQCAIVHNGKSNDKKDIALIYTSSIDKKVKIHKLQYDNIRITNGRYHFRDGFFIVSNHIPWYGLIEDTEALGLIAHNGREIIRPVYLSIESLGDEYMVRHSIEDELENIYKSDVVDYDGKVCLDDRGDILIGNGEIRIKDDFAKVFVSYKHPPKKGDLVTAQLYIVYKDDIYSVYKGKCKTTHKVFVEGDKVTLPITPESVTLTSRNIQKHMRICYRKPK